MNTGVSLGESHGLTSKAWAYFRDPGVKLWKKLLGVFAVAYVILPFDLIPDFIPVLGWLDDVGVVSAVAWYLVRQIRNHPPRGD